MCVIVIIVRDEDELGKRVESVSVLAKFEWDSGGKAESVDPLSLSPPFWPIILSLSHLYHFN